MCKGVKFSSLNAAAEHLCGLSYVAVSSQVFWHLAEVHLTLEKRAELQAIAPDQRHFLV